MHQRTICLQVNHERAVHQRVDEKEWNGEWLLYQRAVTIENDFVLAIDFFLSACANPDVIFADVAKCFDPFQYFPIYFDEFLNGFFGVEFSRQWRHVLPSNRTVISV